MACVDDVPLQPVGRTLQAAVTFTAVAGHDVLDPGRRPQRGGRSSDLIRTSRTARSGSPSGSRARAGRPPRSDRAMQGPCPTGPAPAPHEGWTTRAVTTSTARTTRARARPVTRSSISRRPPARARAPRRRRPEGSTCSDAGCSSHSSRWGSPRARRVARARRPTPDPAPPTPGGSADPAAVGRAFIEALAAGDTATAESMEDATMRARSPGRGPRPAVGPGRDAVRRVRRHRRGGGRTERSVPQRHGRGPLRERDGAAHRHGDGRGPGGRPPPRAAGARVRGARTGVTLGGRIRRGVARRVRGPLRVHRDRGDRGIRPVPTAGHARDADRRGAVPGRRARRGLRSPGPRRDDRAEQAAAGPRVGPRVERASRRCATRSARRPSVRSSRHRRPRSRCRRRRSTTRSRPWTCCAGRRASIPTASSSPVTASAGTSRRGSRPPRRAGSAGIALLEANASPLERDARGTADLPRLRRGRRRSAGEGDARGAARAARAPRVARPVGVDARLEPAAGDPRGVLAGPARLRPGGRRPGPADPRLHRPGWPRLPGPAERARACGGRRWRTGTT